MEEKPAELPVSEQEVQIQPPSILDKLKIHKFKILGAVLGVLVFAGAVFGGYKFLRPKTVNAAEIIKKSLERILEKGTIYHHKALYYRLSLEPNQPEPTPTTYEIWDDQDSDRFKQEVIYPNNGKKVIQVFDGDIRWDYNEEEKTLRKDIYVYPDPAEKEVKHGERLDLVRMYRELLDAGILKGYEGELEGRKVWQVIDERANTGPSYWNTFYFDKETFMLLQQEKWEEKEGRRVRTEKMTYQIMESISKKDLDIVEFFAFGYLLPEDTKVLEKHFNLSMGYVESDYYPATSSGILDPTANWKTYTNTKYGYSIKYPTDWVLQPDKQTPEEIVNFGKDLYSLSIYAGSASTGVPSGVTPSEISSVTIAGQEATREAYEGLKILVKFPEELEVNQIVMSVEYSETFNLMLSTFKFLE